MNNLSSWDALDPARRTAMLLEEQTTLGTRFLQAVARLRQSYPQLDVAPESFASHVATLFRPTSSDLDSALSELRMGDLYLAYACGLGKPEALSIFDASYLLPLRTSIVDIDSSEPKLDELKQILRERLLLGAQDEPARITKYAGRGSLATWVRVAAQRLAISGLRRPSRDVPITEDDLVDHLAPDPDPELVQLRLAYAAEFRDALSNALAELTHRQRVLLRMHLLEGISLSRIAVSYRVSQSTASRWFSQILEQVRDDTKRRFRQLVHLTSAEFDSVARLFEGHLDVSLSRLLRE